MKVIVLATANSKGNQSIVKEFQKLGHECEMINPLKLSVVTGDSDSYDGIYNYETGKKVPFSKVDAIVTRVGSGVVHASTVLKFIWGKYPNIYFSQSPYGMLAARSKLETSLILRQNRIATPRVCYSKDFQDLSLVEDNIGYPCMVKTAVGGSQGAEVDKVDNKKELRLALKGYLQQDNPKSVVVQKLVQLKEAEPVFDIRVLVFNGRAVAAMKRTAAEGQEKSNISLGAKGEEIELSSEQEALCEKAAEVLGLNVAGVDLMVDKNGKSWIIEVNCNYGTKINSVVEIDIHQALAESISEGVQNRNKVNDYHRLRSAEKISSQVFTLRELAVEKRRLDYEIEERLRTIRHLDYELKFERNKRQKLA